MEQRKYISILGDDRSTFEGVTPKIGSFYSPSYVSYAGFATPEGTWWMQLIHRLGGQLLVNNSFAGSHISCAGNYAACLPGRIRSLATEAAAPDLVLVCTGLNDVAHRGALGNGLYSAAKAALERASEALAQEVAAFGIRVMLVDLGAFRRDCRDMVQKLAAQYPDAQIWVETITVGKPSQGPWYLDPATLEDRAAYNDVLRQCVAEAGPSVHLADLTPIDGGYETVNGTHPNRAGMVTFADGWYQAMAGTVPTKG